MQEMTNITHPMNCLMHEVDLVAAGWSNGGGCGCKSGGNGNNVFQSGLINANDVLSNDNVNIRLLSGVSQKTGG